MKKYVSSSSQIAHVAILIKEELDKGKGAIPVTIGKAVKTFVQLGYLHSTVLPIFTATMFSHGEIDKNSEVHAKYHLKVLIGYGQWIKYKNNAVFAPESFADADTEILSRAIDRAILECEQRQVFVPPPKG